MPTKHQQHCQKYHQNHRESLKIPAETTTKRTVYERLGVPGESSIVAFLLGMFKPKAVKTPTRHAILYRETRILPSFRRISSPHGFPVSGNPVGFSFRHHTLPGDFGEITQ